ncbi:hypothetical protein MMC11_006662 [Xylographa trunciseda]|nr:hypothetical protein [Xylographa trunciseda]
MVNLLQLDAATANVTNTTFAYNLSLTDGPFGLQELQSALSFPASNGRSWTLSVQTSDLFALIFIILVSTFAIDHYLFKSRYLVHIRGVRRAKDYAAVLDEKASLHEKEGLNVESGQKISNDEDTNPKSKSEHDSNFAALPVYSRFLRRTIWIVAILFFCAVSDCRKKEESASDTEKKTLEKKSPPTSRWGKFIQGRWPHAISRPAIILVAALIVLGVFAFHLLFWPALLALLILQQCVAYQNLNGSTTVPWQSLALNSTLYLAIWTIIAVTLLLKPNRFSGVLWKCIKWTHAVNWWLFWIVMESYSVGSLVAGRFGVHYNDIALAVMFIAQQLLVAYLYSGVVCDVVVALRLVKYFWDNDVMKL